MTVIAIHQPNFFPWLGYFDKIARSDVFVFLDHVQFQKTGGVWSNRVKMRFGGEGRWVTAPIKRAFHGVARVNEIEWADGQPWREKMVKTLIANYGRAPFFREGMSIVSPLIKNPQGNLAQYNIEAVCSLAASIGLAHDHCVVSSRLAVSGQASDLLVDITRAVGGSAYMCGGGADGYQDEAVFSAAGIPLVYQRFQHPVYSQSGGGEFIPGLSIVDALMNLGAEGVRSLLKIS